MSVTVALCLLSQHLSLNPELAVKILLLALAPTSPCLYLASAGLQASLYTGPTFNVGSESLNSGSQT